MTTEEYSKLIDKAAKKFSPDWDNPEWKEALAKAQSRIIEEYMKRNPGVLKQLKNASSENYRKLTEEEVKEGIINLTKKK